MTQTKHKAADGFTIIELLVVIAIIAMLVGLLTPGISMMNRHARTLKQKTILHSYETGIELFRNDFDYYPPSARKQNALGTGKVVTGAQHLAEALMGRDLGGFDPKSKWCDQNEGPGVYGPASKNRRKTAYTVLKDDGMCSLEELYDVAIGNIFSPAVAAPTPPGHRAPVLTDIFGRRRITLVNNETMKAGTPVLYFCADTASNSFMANERATYNPAPGQANYHRWIYNYEDNEDIFGLGTVQEAKPHMYAPGQTGVEKFYEKIRNPQYRILDTSGKPQSDKPYNASTFILMSAGWDGIFGTKDDVTNFKY